MVLYFTGTGNSRYIAERIAKALDDELFSINDRIKADSREAVDTGSRIVIVAPTYAWRLPVIVSEWISETDFAGAEKIWFVMDCGSQIGNAAKYNRALSDRKNLQYMGTAQIIMPENYIAMFPVPDVLSVLCKGARFCSGRRVYRLRQMRGALSAEQCQSERRQACMGKRLHALHGVHRVLSDGMHRVREKEHRKTALSF